MFEKFLSSFGIGSAKVNTVLNRQFFYLGGKIKGEVHIIGGRIEQEISNIHLELDLTYYKDTDDSELHYLDEELSSLEITKHFTIQPHEEKIIPFELKVPFDAPITFNEQKIFLNTKISIPHAPEAKDINDVNLIDRIHFSILDHFKDLGYHHMEGSGKCLYRPVTEDNQHHFFQLFKLRKEQEEGIEVIFSSKKESVLLRIRSHLGKKTFIIPREGDLPLEEIKEYLQKINSSKN